MIDAREDQSLVWLPSPYLLPKYPPSFIDFRAKMFDFCGCCRLCVLAYWPPELASDNDGQAAT